MKKYKITFIGRSLKSQGVFSTINITVDAETKEDALRKLSDEYEYNHIISVKENFSSKAQEFLNETSQVVKVFKGEENTEVQVTKILNGYSVTVRDLDSGKLLPTQMIYKDNDLDKAIQAAKDIDTGKNPVKSKGYVNV